MSIGMAIAGGVFGRLNEMVQEKDALELAKAKNAKPLKGFELMSWIQGGMQNFDEVKGLFPNLVAVGAIPQEYIPVANQIFNQADSNVQFFGNKQWQFSGYSGDKEAGNLAYHDGMLSGFAQSLNTKEKRLEFFNLYSGDEAFKNEVDTFLNRNATLYKYKFRDLFSAKSESVDYGAVTPAMGNIFRNFAEPEVRKIFEPIFNEYLGDDQNNPNYIAGLGESGDTLKIYNKGSFNEKKAMNGLALPHYDVIEVKLEDIAPNMSKNEVLGGLQQIAERQGTTLPQLLKTINPDLDKYYKGDYAGAFNHLKVALELNKTAVRNLDPQTGIFTTNTEKDAILTTLQKFSNSSNSTVFNTDLAVKAVSLHMLSNKKSDPNVIVDAQTIDSYISDLSGMKQSDITQGFDAATKSERLLKELLNLTKRRGDTGFAAKFNEAILGIFGETGQTQQLFVRNLANTLEFDQTDSQTGGTFDDTVEKFSTEFESLDMSKAYGRTRAIQITLAFALARAEDPSGRLSNQDIEAQMARIGGTNFSNLKMAEASIMQTLSDTQELINFYGIFNDLKGKGSIRQVQQRELDARYVVMQLRKRHMDKLRDNALFSNSTGVETLG